ncbi:hypothetical protein SanaruYs_25060 [Chryseotalea sanaruensis]|uniref:CHRD domain-containing protein n=1 Tax=Chryseotalea sanaruensis TaxID=2482724 RepID=A0A401UBL3_9BACT|nr:hypothetical protein [Chryseotalea sanaruensis]GCC52270.1 hypothetical protein SanaruYs_25060 [Chryseotalea sanaruensis]
MRRWGLILLLIVACEEKTIQEEVFTGNEVVYNLQAGSAYTISGLLTLKEKTDGSTLVSIVLDGTEGDVQHPVHLHMGDLGEADAAIAALLTPVDAKTGKSETILKQLADESAVTYTELVQLSASIKIHLAEAGAGRDVILAGSNIGTAVSSNMNARLGIAVCK